MLVNNPNACAPFLGQEMHAVASAVVEVVEKHETKLLVIVPFGDV